MDDRGVATIEPGRRGGRPVIRGSRIAVADVPGWLAEGMTPQETVADVPAPTEGDIRAALAFAAGRERRTLAAEGRRLAAASRAEPELQARRAALCPGSSQARLRGLDRASDRALWEHAPAGGFALVTQDADFAEMAALHGPPPRVVRLRGGNRRGRSCST